MPSKPNDTPPAIKPSDIPATLPLLPLRDVVIYPHMIFPILVGRESSIKAVNASIESHKFLFVCAQTDPTDDEPPIERLYKEGTVVNILQVLRLPNGLMKVLVEGLFHSRMLSGSLPATSFLQAKVEIIHHSIRMTTRSKALTRQMDTMFAMYVKYHRDLPNETLIGYESLDDPLRKAFYVAANLLVPIEVKQRILLHIKVTELIYELIHIMRSEVEIMKMEMEIDDKVHANIQQSQRKFFIQEQIRILQQEIGEEDEYTSAEYQDIDKSIREAQMPPVVETKAREEFGKLKKMPPLSPEATVIRNYLDWLVNLPWNTYSEDNLSLKNAEKVLNEDHYGLEKPKDRILEHIAVLNLVKEMKGQILCFVGPPGVGKTSLGKSIARALNRKFVRIALGGIHDEGEIRGHRRTYIGSMPGKIVQAMKRAGTSNPVLLLDEIDKMSNDFHGDPTSAMLEVLDPEQNHSFSDHYLDVDYDLSKVMFITTANVRYHIPLPLQDRMEIIELPGYLEHEKLEIALRHLVKKQIQQHGLKRYRIAFSKPALLRVIREYTEEAGVRNLERSIATICRKLARRIQAEEPAGGPKKHIPITPELVEKLLGVPKIKVKKLSPQGKLGSVIGLAWTSTGGDILSVDVTVMNGTEKLTLTGQLGDVMKESAQAALSYIRSHAAEFRLEPSSFEKKEIHVHIPEGAIPKDGPSAGVTMAVAMLSALGKLPARGDVAMTGEITLHGDVLAIGGLTEKLLAARRHGIKTVLIPKDNEPELREISPAVKKGLRIHPIERIDEAVAVSFDTSRRKTPPVRKRNA